jgi:hypothetical protein
MAMPPPCAIGLSDALAAKAMAIPSTQIATLLAHAGKGMGPPWGKDEKMASLAAWTALST